MLKVCMHARYIPQYLMTCTYVCMYAYIIHVRVCVCMHNIIRVCMSVCVYAYNNIIFVYNVHAATCVSLGGGYPLLCPSYNYWA